jgi:hypothetical protein
MKNDKILVLVLVVTVRSLQLLTEVGGTDMTNPIRLSRDQ